jgi:beta-fructofuranosidase
MVELERPVSLAPGKPVELKIFVDGTVGAVYANGKAAMSTRMYNLSMGNWGVFVDEGAARFRNLRLSRL